MGSIIEKFASFIRDWNSLLDRDDFHISEYNKINIDNYSFVSANYSPGMKYGKSTTTNVAISPQFLTKMVNDSDLEDEYIKEIGNMKKLDEQFAK